MTRLPEVRVKTVRYQDGSKTNWGVVEGEVIREMEGDPFGPMVTGDKIDVVIEGIGTLSNHVITEE